MIRLELKIIRELVGDSLPKFLLVIHIVTLQDCDGGRSALISNKNMLNYTRIASNSAAEAYDSP